ncbi:flagellar hook-length control protein FliK [Candidatus Methylomicrobium oryzae]|uniref:flagellar hook-length control protein FliK n=1 Tax=Candidatus Methylomicrobium oryzae TaxID=2802053 RepID=UPI001922B4E0|nr:flagellar hook-length control protein FliK [Methylomicrobium sp. RS1]
MEIRNNATLSNAAATATSPQQIASLKLDAILDVVVQARMGENRFQLQRLPGGEPLTAMSQSELTVGQRLQVQVSRLGALPELRVVPAEPPRPEVVPKALRELLPKQIDLKELATMVGRLPSSNPSNLPGPVHLAVERLAAALPQAEKLMTPEGLQKAVRNSGVFLEASLAAALTEGAPLPENDLKARLLNLLAVLQPGEGGKAAAPAQALQQENALSPPGTVPSQTAAQASEEAGDQASLNPDKVPQRTDSALPKTIGESLLPSQSKGAAEGQFPAAPPAPSLATQSGEKVSVPVPAAAEQSAAKLAADKAANSTEERLAAALPQAEKLMTPEGLQKAVRNSGVFLEASLAAALTEGAPLPENDLKARLLNLLAVLQPGEGGKAAAPAQALQQENALSPPGTVPSQTAAQASEEAGDQASLNPDKVPQRTDSALPKTIGESLLPSQSKGAAEGQFPAAPPAPSLATQSGEKVSVPVPAAAEQSAAKLAADKAANSVDFQKPEKEGLVVGAKPQPFETSLSTARSAPTLPSAGKAEDSFSKPEEIDPAKLAQKAEGALAKIAVDQLASQPRDDGTVCLQLNLPFVAGNHQDNAELSITAEGGSLAEDRVPAWTATIQLQPPCMGAFNARIIWNGTQIDACLWSDREETADRIGQTTETLRARLEQAGLAVGALTVLDRPPSSPLAETVDLHLLDLLA